MFSMFRFLMEDKSVVYRIIRLLILILTIYVSYVSVHKSYERVPTPRGWSLLDYDRWRKAVVS